MRKILPFFVMFFCLTNVQAAQVGEQDVEFTVSQAYVSRYISQGQDNFGDDDGAYQPSVDATFPGLFWDTDVSLTLWGSFALSDGHEDADELDYCVSLSRNFEFYNLSSGYSYFDYVNTDAESDTNELWLSWTLFRLPILPVDVSLTLSGLYDFEAVGGGPKDGWYYSWALGTGLALPRVFGTQEGQILEIAIENWGNDGVADLEHSSLYATDYSLSTTYAFGELSITPVVHFVANYDDLINDEDEFWGGVDVSYSF